MEATISYLRYATPVEQYGEKQLMVFHFPAGYGRDFSQRPCVGLRGWFFRYLLGRQAFKYQPHSVSRVLPHMAEQLEEPIVPWWWDLASLSDILEVFDLDTDTMMGLGVKYSLHVLGQRNLDAQGVVLTFGPLVVGSRLGPLSYGTN